MNKTGTVFQLSQEEILCNRKINTISVPVEQWRSSRFARDLLNDEKDRPFTMMVPEVGSQARENTDER